MDSVVFLDCLHAELAQQDQQLGACDQRCAQTDAHDTADTAQHRIETHRRHLVDSGLAELAERDLELDRIGGGCGLGRSKR